MPDAEAASLLQREPKEQEDDPRDRLKRHVAEGCRQPDPLQHFAAPDEVGAVGPLDGEERDGG